jgi:Tol biopolymer transport system component
MQIDHHHWTGRSLLRVAAVPVVAVALAACSSGDGGRGDRSTPGAERPASGLIVYEGRGGGTDPNAVDIYTVDAATGETARLTSDGNSRQPAWSPDHASIVFASDAGNEDKQEDLYIMRADGSDVRRLTSTPGVSEWHPRISPDGSRIAYMSVAGNISFVKVMDIDGSGERQVGEAFKLLRSGVWSVDGREVLFSGLEPDEPDFAIYAIDVETGVLRVLIDTEHSEACPHLTEDGRTLTYGSVSDESGETVNIDVFAHDMASDDTSGASDARLTDDLTVDDYADPDPSGGGYVFVSRRDGNPELYLMAADGADERRLTNTPALSEDNPDW